MNSVELYPGIILYKGIDTQILKNIKNIPEDLWKFEYIQKNGILELDKNTRNTLAFNVPRKVNEDSSDTLNILCNNLNVLLGGVEKDYCSQYNVALRSKDPYKILKYEVGGKFDLHMDDGGANFKRISTIFYLNDNYEGGELHFKNFDVKIKPESGDMVVFPSSYVFSHFVTEVTKGTRYSIASWMR